MKSLSGLPLDFFVVFSSTSTAIAPVGQIDYVAANDFLNAYAQSRAAGKGVTPFPLTGVCGAR
jgi:hypothetical protein